MSSLHLTTHQAGCWKLLFSLRWYYCSVLWFLPHPQPLAYFLQALPVYHIWLSLLHQGACTRSELQYLGSCGFNINTFGSCKTGWGCWGEVFSVACQLPAGILNAVSGNCVPLVHSDVLICLFPNLLPPPSHGGTASILWVVQERNGFLQHYYIHLRKLGIHSLFSLSPEEGPCWLVWPHARHLGEGLVLVKFNLF